MSRKSWTVFWLAALLLLFVFNGSCLLYTSDAADDLLCVDLGGRRYIKKKTKKEMTSAECRANRGNINTRYNN